MYIEILCYLRSLSTIHLFIYSSKNFRAAREVWRTKLNLFSKRMTLAEKNAADSANSQIKEVGGFSNSFRSSELNNLQDGEIITIPEDYKVFERKIGSGENARTAQYINCPTNTGRIVQFYPTAMARVAFVVDENGKNIRENNRMVVRRSEGDVCTWIDGKEIDSTVKAMKGCAIEYKVLDRVKTRAFGVDESAATAADVTETIIGGWNFSGKKRPVGYVTK